MALTNAFYQAVQNEDVLSVRIMMKDSLLVDPTFVEFNAMEKAASSMARLYDEHDGKELIEDRNLWNEDKVMVKVLSNFSHKRVNHLKEVVRYLRPVTKTVAPKKEQTSHQTYITTQKGSYEEEKRRCQERGDYLGAKIGAGAVVGAAVGGVIATVTGATLTGVVGSAAAGAVVGGVATALIVNWRK